MILLYRRKVLLALLQGLGREVDSISFQKILFLLTEKQRSKSFDFIPYQFGCYSFQANAEMKVLERNGFLKDLNNVWKIENKENWFEQLENDDRSSLTAIVHEFGSWTKDKLIYWTYTEHPYYAINSKIAREHLNEMEMVFAETARPKVRGTALLTTGYEGISLEHFLNRLIKEGVKLLCDVRKNPASMKYGFARKTLEKACGGVHIEYRHIPELGIDGELRKNLLTKQDYEALFKHYDAEILPSVVDKQNELVELVHRYERVAITCFEADPKFCHRSHLSAAIENRSNNEFEVRHL
jgi:hypothetical protein